jgi:uncharacterized protein YihD (DUF1040 family)
MTTLLDFLADNPVNDLTEEVVISERLKDFKFKIKAMTGNDFDDYTKQCRKIGKKGKVDFDSQRFNMLVILNHTVEPDFRNVKTLEKAKCQTPEDFINKSLLAGEIAELAQAISRLSGFDQDINELADEVKN